MSDFSKNLDDDSLSSEKMFEVFDQTAAPTEEVTYVVRKTVDELRLEMSGILSKMGEDGMDPEDVTYDWLIEKKEEFPDEIFDLAGLAFWLKKALAPKLSEEEQRARNTAAILELLDNQ